MKVLEYQDNADDICVLSSKHLDAPKNAERLSKTANTINLNVITKNTHVLWKNTRVNDPVRIDGKHLEDVEEFNYLGTKVTTTCNCDQETNTRISKVNQAFTMQNPVWKTTNLSVHNMTKIFRSTVLSVLLYGTEL